MEAVYAKYGVDGLKFILDMEEEGHTNIKVTNDGHWVGIFRFMFTHAIIKGRIGDRGSYDDRWCYKSYGPALIALDNWDGVNGEPEGWHRHPATGRRVAEDGTMYINK